MLMERNDADHQLPLRKKKKKKSTFGAEVVHQDDLLDEVRRRAVEHAVHRAQQRGPHLVHEAEDHAGGGQVVVHQGLSTPGGARDMGEEEEEEGE